MKALTARDCLCPRLLRVHAEQRYRDVVGPGDGHRLFSVVSDAGHHIGIVTERQAALFPKRIFADLIVLRQPQPVSADTDLATLHALTTDSTEGYVPVQEQDGSLLGVVSELSVFVALSESERRLREEQEELVAKLGVELRNRRMAAGVFESTSEGIMVTDPQLRILLVNKAFSDTTGYSEAEVLGQTPTLLGSGRHDASFYTAMWASIHETGGWSGEIWNRRRNGEIYPEWLHINTVRDPEDGSIQHFIGVFSDVTHFKSVQSRLHELAYYDPLTNLPNRQLLLDRLEQAVAQAHRDHGGFSLIIIDLDRFKDVNDSLGHGFGDRILVECAHRLRTLVRASDTVARLGGDEFTVMIADAQAEWSTAAVALKIIEALSHPIIEGDRTVFLSASIGITRYPDDALTAGELLRHADTAMYRAKEEGRNRYCFYTPELHDRVSQRLRLETELRECLRQDALTIAWQPQVRLSDHALVGCEVLARWNHPEFGEVSPTRFIPIAEDSGLIIELGRQVLDNALAKMVAWRGSNGHSPPRLRVAINVSAIQLRSPDAIDDIMQRIRRHGLDPADVELELTESALMDREQSANTLVHKLGEHGIRLAVDDFGTGYSNLAYLKRFAVHRLKIDRAFIEDLTTDHTDRQIVSAIIAIGHSLGLEVVAEGVETAEQAALLRELGCDEAQGYYFGKPGSFDELQAYGERTGPSNDRLA